LEEIRLKEEAESRRQEMQVQAEEESWRDRLARTKRLKSQDGDNYLHRRFRIEEAEAEEAKRQAELDKMRSEYESSRYTPSRTTSRNRGSSSRSSTSSSRSSTSSRSSKWFDESDLANIDMEYDLGRLLEEKAAELWEDDVGDVDISNAFNSVSLKLEREAE